MVNTVSYRIFRGILIVYVDLPVHNVEICLFSVAQGAKLLLKTSYMALLKEAVSPPHIHVKFRVCSRPVCTVRLLTNVLCKPTHFFFHSCIATMSYPPQTSFSSLMKDWADKYHVWGTPTRSPSRSNSR